MRRPVPSNKKFRNDRPEGPSRIVGVLTKTSAGWRLQSTNKRERGEFILHAKTRFDLQEGHLAVAEISPQRHWPKEAKLIELLGDQDSAGAVSLIAIATHEIPDVFGKEALREADAARPVTLEGRTDLRDIPLVTIDGPDARDFDDAVFAEPDGDGWHLIVAIADVAHYVKSASALDKTAYERGNSVYFPDRVVPMLPEALSNELCSLKPQVERACMAVHLWIDNIGELTRWKFVRGVMRSRARLTYEQVQQAMDGHPDSTTQPLLDPVIKPLYGAFRILIQARGKRGTLELDLPERKVEIEKGRVKSIKVRDRLDSHRLIEEFMITANVAAAAQLEQKGGFCLYRIHDKPSEAKLDALRDFLDTLNISLVPGRQLHPRFLTQILENSAGGPHAQVVNEMMLRSQAQAVYSHQNIGHFGLALAKYAHFTSPIRRYADLVVHRGLIRALKLGNDGLTDREGEELETIADHISTTERRAAMAERDATDRFITLFMADRVGATFPARISGVARFGLFARLDETGADGIIPLENLPNDYYFHDEKKQALIGRRTKRIYQLAQPVTVKLEKADRLTGSMAFGLVEEGKDSRSAPVTTKKDHSRKRQKPFRRRGRR
ncbi:MAG: ribonuclease R [Alphaproteobacteria bacterium]|nr:ribonuclease R [Alphaproteobacteria bacterium]